MASQPRTTLTNDALTMAQGMNQAIAMLDSELGTDKGADYPFISKQARFMNELRYTLLNKLPPEYDNYSAGGVQPVGLYALTPTKMEFTLNPVCVLSEGDRRFLLDLQQILLRVGTEEKKEEIKNHHEHINAMYTRYVETILLGTQQKDLAQMILEEETTGSFTPFLCEERTEQAQLMVLTWLMDFPVQMNAETAAHEFLRALNNRLPARYLMFGAYQQNRFKK